MEVKDLDMRQVLATNCKKTVEAELETEKGRVRASIPIGTSTGKYEVKYLPVEKVIENFSEIKKQFESKEFSSLEEVDQKLKDIDKTSDFSKIGGNLAIAMSSVFLKAFAMHKGQEVFQYLKGKSMPKLLANVAGGWGEESEIQEFLLFPEKQKSFREVIFRIAEAYLELGKILKRKDNTFKFSKNYESGWVTNLSTEKLLEILSGLCKDYKLRIGMDVAASDRWDGKTYIGRTPEEQREFISKIVKDFDTLFVEDPFHQDDFDSFSWLTGNFSDVMVCGDDLYVTNPERLKTGIEKKATNAVLIKPNQIGTITDIIKVVDMGKKHQMTTVISHRSGTTDETLLCHLAVGLNCDYAKFGISGERIIKINELLRIEEKL